MIALRRKATEIRFPIRLTGLRSSRIARRQRRCRRLSMRTFSWTLTICRDTSVVVQATHLYYEKIEIDLARFPDRVYAVCRIHCKKSAWNHTDPKKKRCCKRDASFREPSKTRARWTRVGGCQNKEKILQKKTRRYGAARTPILWTVSPRPSKRKRCCRVERVVTLPCQDESPLDSSPRTFPCHTLLN